MARYNDEPVADRLEITATGVYLDGHKLPTADSISVEHAADDLHVVTLQLLVKDVDAPDSQRVHRTEAATYQYVQRAEAVTA